MRRLIHSNKKPTQPTHHIVEEVVLGAHLRADVDRQLWRVGVNVFHEGELIRQSAHIQKHTRIKPIPSYPTDPLTALRTSLSMET